MNGFISHVYLLCVSFRTSLGKIYDVCIYVSWPVCATRLDKKRKERLFPISVGPMPRLLRALFCAPLFFPLFTFVLSL